MYITNKYFKMIMD